MKSVYGRRSVLRVLGGCACCMPFASRLSATEKGEVRWGYDGETGPDHWGELSSDFTTCEIGMQQTPIDLKGAIKAEHGDKLGIDYKAVPGEIVNNGHTIQINVGEGCVCTIGDISYNLLQFHFHHPSEHLLSGKAQEMEAHFVHKSQNGGLAVIGVFIRKGKQNDALEPVFSILPLDKNAKGTLPEAYDPSTLFPSASSEGARPYFRYYGSLTTPPCSEGLVWTVFKEPIEASEDQIRRFSALFPHNARPEKPLNRRFLLEFGL